MPIMKWRALSLPSATILDSVKYPHEKWGTLLSDKTPPLVDLHHLGWFVRSHSYLSYVFVDVSANGVHREESFFPSCNDTLWWWIYGIEPVSIVTVTRVTVTQSESGGKTKTIIKQTSSESDYFGFQYNKARTKDKNWFVVFSANKEQTKRLFPRHLSPVVHFPALDTSCTFWHCWSHIFRARGSFLESPDNLLCPISYFMRVIYFYYIINIINIIIIMILLLLIFTLSNDPHKKESANGNARWNANFFHCYN